MGKKGSFLLIGSGIQKRKPKMIVFDTETTGLLKPKIVGVKKQPHCIELGAIKFKNGVEVDRIDFTFSCPIPLPEQITKITGLTDEKLKGQPSFLSQANRVCDFFNSDPSLWVGHNVMFDLDILTLNLQRVEKLSLLKKPKRLFCTAMESRHLTGRRMKLGDLHKMATGETFKGAHRAINDAEATFRCYQWLQYEIK